jgi:hypothetical protein
MPTIPPKQQVFGIMVIVFHIEQIAIANRHQGWRM